MFLKLAATLMLLLFTLTTAQAADGKLFFYDMRGEKIATQEMAGSYLSTKHKMIVLTLKTEEPNIIDSVKRVATSIEKSEGIEIALVWLTDQTPSDRFYEVGVHVGAGYSGTLKLPDDEEFLLKKLMAVVSEGIRASGLHPSPSN